MQMRLDFIQFLVIVAFLVPYLLTRLLNLFTCLAVPFVSVVVSEAWFAVSGAPTGGQVSDNLSADVGKQW